MINTDCLAKGGRDTPPPPCILWEHPSVYRSPKPIRHTSTVSTIRKSRPPKYFFQARDWSSRCLFPSLFSSSPLLPPLPHTYIFSIRPAPPLILISPIRLVAKIRCFIPRRPSAPVKSNIYYSVSPIYRSVVVTATLAVFTVRVALSFSLSLYFCIYEIIRDYTARDHRV